MEYSTLKSKEKSKINDLKDFVDKIKTIFIMQRSTSIKINDLCEKIKENSLTISSIDSLGIYFFKNF